MGLEGALDPVAVAEDDEDDAGASKQGLNPSDEADHEVRAATVKIVDHDHDGPTNARDGAGEMTAKAVEGIAAAEAEALGQSVGARDDGFGEKGAEAPQEGDRGQPAKGEAEGAVEEETGLRFFARYQSPHSEPLEGDQESQTDQCGQEQGADLWIGQAPADLGQPQLRGDVHALKPG
jgi:hypothetical protein